VTRRPRAPLALRAHASEPTRGGLVVPPSAVTLALPAPPLAARRLELEPPVATRAAGAGDGRVDLRALDVRPAVDVAPESLRTQVFALRLERCGPALLRGTRRARLLAAPSSRRATPAQALHARLEATRPERLEGSVLRGCLTALLERSAAPDPSDLSLVGIYERAPTGAIAAVALVEGAVQVRLAPGRRPRPGLLVVGRRRSTGEVVTVEVPPDGRN
jgi:hypothetical protein